MAASLTPAPLPVGEGREAMLPLPHPRMGGSNRPPASPPLQGEGQGEDGGAVLELPQCPHPIQRFRSKTISKLGLLSLGTCHFKSSINIPLCHSIPLQPKI